MNIFARGIITAAALLSGAGLLSAQDFILQAHRGLSNKFPENTTLSFFEAAKIPVYKGMETDVSMTKDGALVCMHDSRLDRTTNGTDTLSKYTMKELQELWIDGGYGWDEKYKETLKIPTFETYLEACKLGGFTPYVELKWIRGEGVRKTIQALHDFGFDGNYVLTSFTWENILLASTMTDAPLEFMKAKFTKEMIDTCSAKVKNLVIRPKSTNVTQELVDHCHSKGIPVECYGIPVGRADLVKKLISMGVRGGTCNDWEGLGLDGNLSVKKVSDVLFRDQRR